MSYRWKTPGLARGLARRVGFRGVLLVLLGVVDFAYGRTFVWTGDPGTRATNRFLIEVVPVSDHNVAAWIWLMIWWVTGAFCLVNAFRREDRWGYGMAVALKIVYVGAIVIAGERGMPNAGTRLLVWSFIALFVFIEARRGEPSRTLAEVSHDMDTGDIPREGGRSKDA